jgi:hypothetical protein
MIRIRNILKKDACLSLHRENEGLSRRLKDWSGDPAVAKNPPQYCFFYRPVMKKVEISNL